MMTRHMSDTIDALVIGAGIIGSSIAYQLAELGLCVVICDESKNLGDGISGRNSSVLHSGIYYKDHSKKLEHCLRGYRDSLQFFETHQIPYRICGKLITNGNDQTKESLSQLERLYEQGRSRDIPGGIDWVSDVDRKYPFICGSHAIWVPCTGVVDTITYLKTLWRRLEGMGVILLKHRQFVIEAGEPFLVDMSDSRRKDQISSSVYINASGLATDTIARQFGVEGYEIRPNKGEYYRLNKKLPMDFLVYPLPHRSSSALGVHYTFNIAGECYAGPSSLWAHSKSDYEFETSQRDFYQSLSNITTFYQEKDLREGYVGLRPRLFYQGEPLSDFVIHTSKDLYHSIHLLGIESPGLTSAPSIAREVCDLVMNARR